MRTNKERQSPARGTHTQDVAKTAGAFLTPSPDVRALADQLDAAAWQLENGRMSLIEHLLEVRRIAEALRGRVPIGCGILPLPPLG